MSEQIPLLSALARVGGDDLALLWARVDDLKRRAGRHWNTAQRPDITEQQRSNNRAAYQTFMIAARLLRNTIAEIQAREVEP